jgi:hypothetical protein
MHTEESGKRIKVTGTINATADDAAIIWLARRLAERFGGATLIAAGHGCWVDADGVLVTEPATIVEVSFLLDADSERNVDAVRHLMVTTQFSVGGEWTHIEVTQFDAFHTHVEHYPCASIA